MNEVLPSLAGDLREGYAEKLEVSLICKLHVAVLICDPDHDWSGVCQFPESLLILKHLLGRRPSQSGHLQMCPDARDEFPCAERLD